MLEFDLVFRAPNQVFASWLFTWKERFVQVCQECVRSVEFARWGKSLPINLTPSFFTLCGNEKYENSTCPSVSLDATIGAR
jgi:hypothetical protein